MKGQIKSTSPAMRKAGTIAKYVRTLNLEYYHLVPGSLGIYDRIQG